MTARSSLYVGSVMHRRLAPKRHHFRYRVFWLLLDLQEISATAGRLKWFSYNAPNIFSLYDRDFGDGSATPINTQVERQLKQANIDLAGGRIFLLSMPRTFGYSFNPLSIFFCHRADGSLAAVVYEVHNTFGERHTYLMRVETVARSWRHACRKMFYVSPFMDLDMHYDFRISSPDERVTVGISASQSNVPVFTAAMSGERRDLTDSNLLRVFVRIPAVTLKVIAAIHWEALRLWLKRVPLVRRPQASPPVGATMPAASNISD